MSAKHPKHSSRTRQGLANSENKLEIRPNSGLKSDGLAAVRQPPLR
jgi:hypothetical protein